MQIHYHAIDYTLNIILLFKNTHFFFLHVCVLTVYIYKHTRIYFILKKL
jgi:hypothetical protein